jgi:hypothetical protein
MYIWASSLGLISLLCHLDWSPEIWPPPHPIFVSRKSKNALKNSANLNWHQFFHLILRFVVWSHVLSSSRGTPAHRPMVADHSGTQTSALVPTQEGHGVVTRLFGSRPGTAGHCARRDTQLFFSVISSYSVDKCHHLRSNGFFFYNLLAKFQIWAK